MTTGTLDIPAGARVPIGNPRPWLAAAIAADWQCECVTGAGRSACGRSHRDDEGHRCRHSATGHTAMRLILAPAADGALRLLCEPCAAGHSRAAARLRAAAEAAPAECEQGSLFTV